MTAENFPSIMLKQRKLKEKILPYLPTAFSPRKSCLTREDTTPDYRIHRASTLLTARRNLLSLDMRARRMKNGVQLGFNGLPSSKFITKSSSTDTKFLSSFADRESKENAKRR